MSSFQALKTVKMTVKEWIAVEDNPIQRDTERHAARASHLRIPMPTHSFVFAAELPSGKLIKLDGHTRAYLWKQNEIPWPGFLQVGIIPVKDRAEAEALYKTFDSTNALETMKDKVSGAFNRFGLEMKSPFMRTGAITQSLRIAYAVLKGAPAVRGISGVGRKGGNVKDGVEVIVDVYEMTKEFQNELIALDAFNLKGQEIQAGLTVAFILTYRRHGKSCLLFWQNYFSKQGVRANGKMDGVQALREWIMSRKTIARGGTAKSFVASFGGGASIEVASRAVGAVEGWMNDEKFRTKPRPYELLGYLEGHHRPTERLIKKHDLSVAIRG